MKTLSMKTLAAASTFAVLLSVSLPSARADEWNKETIFTFSAPVEVPGMTLPAGTYVFKLLDSKSDRNVVQIFDKNDQHIYGTFLTISDYRLTPHGKTVVMFEERAANAPEAIKAWFYPGDLYGNEFVYPKARAVAFAQQTQQPVPSMPEPAATAAPAPASDTVIAAQQPSGNEVQVAQAFQTTPPTAAPAQPAPTVDNNDTSATTTSQTLPATASDTPLIALFGLLGVAAGAGMLARKQQSVSNQ
jgi:LPXTG-motif cell wall-anchored protein